MSQINLHEIIHQQQEHLVAMQAQIQALLAVRVGGAGSTEREMMGPQIEVAKPAIFNGETRRVGGFVIACRLYLKMKMKEAIVEEQVQWALSYVQGGSVNIWKENVMEKLEAGEIKYKTVEEFLTSLKKNFGGEEEESVKAAELRKLEQGGRTMEEFMQELKRVARGSGYEERPLVEEFKREMNGVIRRKLMEAKNQPGSIEQWYRRAMALDRNWRESKREEERLRGKKETGGKAPKQIMPQPLVWQRRQMLSQQATTEPALMEEVERTNAVVVRRQGQSMGAPRKDLYMMEVDRGRNCYACGGFGHMACHYRNWGQSRRVEKGKRLEYGRGVEGNFEHLNNLKGVENLESLN